MIFGSRVVKLQGLPYLANVLLHFTYRWLFGDLGCQAYAFEGMISGIASIYSLAAIAIDCYFSVKKPEKCELLNCLHFY